MFPGLHPGVNNVELLPGWSAVGFPYILLSQLPTGDGRGSDFFLWCQQWLSVVDFSARLDIYTSRRTAVDTLPVHVIHSLGLTTRLRRCSCFHCVIPATGSVIRITRLVNCFPLPTAN